MLDATQTLILRHRLRDILETETAVLKVLRERIRDPKDLEVLRETLTGSLIECFFGHESDSAHESYRRTVVHLDDHGDRARVTVLPLRFGPATPGGGVRCHGPVRVIDLALLIGSSRKANTPVEDGFGPSLE